MDDNRRGHLMYENTNRAGLGLAQDSIKTLAKRLIRKDEEKKKGNGRVEETALDRWIKTDVLIVDEGEPHDWSESLPAGLTL